MGCPNTMRSLKGRLVVVRTYGLVAILAQPKSIHSEGETSSNLVDVFFLFIIIQSYYILSKQDVWVYYSTKPENVYNRPFEGETSENNNKLRQSKLNCRFWRSDWLVRTKKFFFWCLMGHPSKIWHISQMPDVVRAYWENFLKIYPNIWPRFSEIFIWPSHL